MFKCFGKYSISQDVHCWAIDARENRRLVPEHSKYSRVIGGQAVVENLAFLVRHLFHIVNLFSFLCLPALYSRGPEITLVPPQSSNSLDL